MNYQRAKEIFLKVCDLAAAAREPIIKQECMGDQSLEREVRSLLSFHDAERDDPDHHHKRFEDNETAPRPIRPPQAKDHGSEAFSVEAGMQPMPERIGRYKVLRRLGTGGMGVVYLAARDDDQFRKRVAIKVIKKGMDSEEILRRFDQERQVLSALNHPNIARMLDGGSTDDGRPYFVMEFIEGMPITEYADKNRLRIEERLTLFSMLCQAVHHAHQNLIVHRDIKPSNVVVTTDGTLKLLDFGIAKLLNPELAVFASEPTATNFRLMTPEYASPEQVRGDPLSTASDVYSLGVLLYELVTGRRPYRFKTRLQSEIERVICNEDPERPSTAVTHDEEVIAELALPHSANDPPTTRTTTVQDIAIKRDAKPDRLRRKLSGDIDNIVLMAMRKEPRRRYTSAEQFAADIHRHLDGMPVVARPATLPYRLGKFIQRNKAGVAVTAAIMLLLTAWGISATSLYREADYQRGRAADRERDANEQRDEVARQKQLVEDSLEKSRTVQRLTAEALRQLPQSLTRIPGTAEARQQAIAFATDYLHQFESVMGEKADDRDIARFHMLLGDAQGGRRSANTGNTDSARVNYTKGLAIWQRLATASPNDLTITRELANAHIRVADLSQGEEKASHYQHAMTLSERLLAANPNDTDAEAQLATAVDGVAVYWLSLNKLAEAEAPLRRSLQLRENIALRNPDEAQLQRQWANGLVRFAEFLEKQNQFTEAAPHYEKAFAITQTLFSADPTSEQMRRDMGNRQRWIGRNLSYQQKWEAAHQRLLEAEKQLAALQNDAPNDARVLAFLGLAQMDVGHNLCRWALEISDQPLQKTRAAEAVNFYQRAVQNLTPSRQLPGYLFELAHIHRNWARMAELLEDRTALQTQLSTSIDMFRELKMDDAIKEAEDAKKKADAAPASSSQ